MADIVILGAGLTGLSAAYHLERSGYTAYKLFEKDQTVGGLCRSVTQDGFTFDYTGHLLHINDPYFEQFITQHVGFENFNTIHRRSYIYSHATYTPYPFQVNLHGLPLDVVTECIEGFLNRRSLRSKRPSFYQWVLASFGAGFGRHFFFPYQTKIFDFDVKKLSASWTGRFVPATSLKELIKGAIHAAQSENSIGYNAQFWYPKHGGIEYWIQKLHKQIKQPIYTGFAATQIDTVRKIVHFANGHAEPYQTLITTLPLNLLLAQLREHSSTTLYRATAHLKCNSVINFNLGIKRPDLSDKHWIYFPETQIPFYRIGFTHNFAHSMAPAGCSSLYGEFSLLNKPQERIPELLQAARSKTQQLFNIQDHEIVTEKIIHIPHAYVIFDRWRDTNIEKIHQKLADYRIYSVGRYGAWKYASMQEGLLDGKEIAQKLLESKAF